ncbi:hypothetical protein DFH08DRAFT_802197 [Mycena albidolilacea]|uniref:Uncharacterized protein n=1 Tax=Mycena albidolilacea TaxID=1033008 RepID=A0AAD7F082_9AGAR|nr:hypothetical protein DFH08DRAFT_802197 [Mycena albidolilacea]
MLRRTSSERPPPAPLITTRGLPTGDAPPAQVEAVKSWGEKLSNATTLIEQEPAILVVVEESEPHERIVPPSRKMDSIGRYLQLDDQFPMSTVFPDKRLPLRTAHYPRNPLDMAALERLSIQREGQECRVNLASVIIAEFERFMCGRIEVVKHDKALGRNIQEHEPVVEYGNLSKQMRFRVSSTGGRLPSRTARNVRQEWQEEAKRIDQGFQMSLLSQGCNAQSTMSKIFCGRDAD